jgi:hypothetical protein
MELDELKTVIKSSPEKEPVAFGAAKLDAFARKNTGSIIDKIKRSILLECAAGLVIAGLALWAWFQYPSPLVRPFAMLATMLDIICVIYLLDLFYKLKNHEKTLLSVKEKLEQIIDLLQKFIKLYYQLVALILLISFSFGLILIIQKANEGPHAGAFDLKVALAIYFGWFLLWIVLTYFFSKWYIKKLYGNYLLQLKNQLLEIENG